MKRARKIFAMISALLITVSACMPMSCSAATVKKGDVNLDGSVTASDVLHFIQYELNQVSFSEEAAINADIDSNGEIKLTDLAYLKQHVVGDKISFISGASTELTENDYSASEENVKMLGRTHMEDGILWLAQSASGIEFDFTGTSAEITIVGDNAITTDNPARFAVYVNGERVADELVKSAEKTYRILANEEASENNVRIVKLSESANSTLGIKNIKVKSVGAIKPAAYKDYTIEFIGDSITCGYGVDVEDRNLHFSTSTEDATKTYAYQTAQRLNADYSFVSYSGYGVISGYTSNGIKSPQILPTCYEDFSFSYGYYNGFNVGTIDWDFNKLVPDMIVINLGTNDSNYCQNDAAKQQEFTDGYVDFIKQVRSKNPNAYILCTLGIMGDTLYKCVESAVSTYTSQTGDKNISSMAFDVQKYEDGYGADWHPSLVTHTKAADKLTAEIEKIMGKQ